MNLLLLEREIWLPRPLDEVFAFFADARNLEIITPPWLHFRILTPGNIHMRQGTRIDYTLRLHGIPFRWQAEISRWEPPRRFVDVQRRGPYRVWSHEHWFEAKSGGTIASDAVTFAAPGGYLVHKLFVEREVKKIFDYRAGKLKEVFQNQG